MFMYWQLAGMSQDEKTFETVEMPLLNEMNDDEEEITVFDVRRK